ncbi:MAG: T9SS type A sorting domain-containing protein [Bacteroidales bacterium]
MKTKIYCVLAAFILFSLEGALAQMASQWDKVPDAIKSRNAYKRLEWFYKPRLNEQGIFPRAFIERQKESEMQKMQSPADNAYSSFQWTNLGPVGVDFANDVTVKQWGIVSGRVMGMAVHPTNPDVVYAGTGGGGIWKSTDGGQNWVDKSGGLNLITFGAIAIDPSNPEVIYAGTGEYTWVLTERFYSGDGLYKSINGGDNWTKIEAEFDTVTEFTALAVSPHNPNVVIAAIAKNLNGAFQNQGIWRSADAGIHWTCVLPGEGMYDLAFHPADPNIVYASRGNEQSGAGFLVSTDGGLTFSQSNTGLPPASHIGRIQFDVFHPNPSVLYTAIYDKTPLPGGFNTSVYKSINAGSSWSQISPGVNLSAFGDQGFYDLCIAVDPSNPDHVFLGNVEFSSSSNGSTFSYIRDPNAAGGGNTAFDSYTHFDHHVIRIAPSDPSVIYVGCDGGVFRSADGGVSFLPANTGITSIQLYRVASHISNPDILYSGAQDNGFISTHNRGATAYKLENFADGTECFMDYSDANVIFFETFCGFLGRSINGGQSWDLSVDPGSNDSNAFISPYWQNPVEPNIIYGCIKQKLLKSTDKGTTWAYTTSTPITSTAICFAAQSPLNPSNIMVAARNGTVSLARSGDGGYSWQDITGSLGSLSGGNFMRLVADPRDGNTFYLLKNTYSGALIVKTTDFGYTWADISSDLPKVPVNDLFVDTANAGVMYLGNDFGVYRTASNGGSWERLNNGMPFVPVLDFDYYNYAGKRLLRAATFGKGLYELDLNHPEAVRENNPGTATLQAWPNPASDRLWIELGIFAPGDCVISLVSADGKEVESRTVYASRTTMRSSIDISRLEPGCYQLLVKGRQQMQSYKVLIVK